MRHAKRMRWGHGRLGIGAVLGIAAIASCSSSKSPSGGARVEHVVCVDPPPAPLPTAIPPPPPTAPPTPASVSVTPPPPDPAPPPPKSPLPSEVLQVEYGLELSPLEKAIVDDCPERAWSTKVPQIDCTKDAQCPSGECVRGRCGVKCTNDNQCGDGFCDRGTCKGLWTCGAGFGHHCDRDDQCGAFCIKGRCRSCVSNAECSKRLGTSDAFCGYHAVTDSHMCHRPEDFVSSGIGGPGPMPVLPGSSVPPPPQRP
jgi:hypothetical protein